MSDFYNRYRGLFDSLPSQPLQNPFQKQQLRLGDHRYDLVKPTFTPSLQMQKKTNHLNISRSPALDEFQRNVLPKLNTRLPQMEFKRLKTEMSENTSKMEKSLNKDSSLQMNLYQLPKLYAPSPKQIKRERIHTEGQAPQTPRKRFKEIKNISKNIESLEKEYFRAYPKAKDQILEQSKESPSQLNQSRSRVLTQQKKASRITQNMQNIVKRWENKVLNEPQYHRSFEDRKHSPKPNQDKELYREYQKKQNQLYGVKDNPYAFVNSKLEQIKKSEKYYPRGYINQYRDALFRRRKQKNMIEERRQRLRDLLFEDNQKYNAE